MGLFCKEKTVLHKISTRKEKGKNINIAYPTIMQKNGTSHDNDGKIFGKKG